MKLTLRFLACAATGLIGLTAFAADSTESTTPKLRKGPPPSVEMEAYRKLVLSIYDTDKNGALDETEREVLKEDIATGKMEPPPHPVGRGRHGPPPEILAKYDANSDGVLDETERATLEADIKSGKLVPPTRGPAPDGPPPPLEDSATSASTS